MATLSITAAAKLFKRSRNTIRNHLKSGALSYSSDGSTIDMSELIRLYGAAPTSPDKSVQTVAPDRSESMSQKDIDLAVAKAKIEGLEALLEEREKRILLLENKQKSWLSRLLNR